MIEKRKQIRRSIIKQRKSLKRLQQIQSSQIISKRLTKTLLFLRSKRIAFYFATRGEVDPYLVVKKALDMGKECFYPILHPVKHNQMWFARYQLGDKLKKNCYGILEPNLHETKLISAWSLDVVIMPLVAFDSNGNRIGMGGGYYDRTFSSLSHRIASKPKLVGLAYEFQKVPLIQSGVWDVPLNYIVTEEAFYTISAKADNNRG